MESQNVKERELRKVFKGKTEFIIDHSTPEKLAASKLDRHFHQRMLRAYLKGKEYFNFGFYYDSAGVRQNQQHKVLYSWE